MKRTLLTLTIVLASSVGSQSFGFDLLDRMLGMRGCGSSASCCDTGCDTPLCEPACGCEVAGDPYGCDPCGCAAEPACGLDAACGCAEPVCGCEAPCDPCGADPACGCEVACDPCGCDSGCGKQGGLLSKLFSHGKSSCCDSACEPACGLEAACDPCAADPVCGCEVVACDPCGCDSGCSKRGGLLSKLFGNLHGKSSCCDAGCDGCGCGVAPMNGHAPSAAPMPPAPAPEEEASYRNPPRPIVDPSASVSSKRRVIQASAVYVR